HAPRVKGMNDVTDGLDRTAHPLRNGLWGPLLGTREDDLGTPDTAGVCRASVGFQLPTLLISQGSDKDWWFHSLSISRELRLHKNSCGDALGSHLSTRRPTKHHGEEMPMAFSPACHALSRQGRERRHTPSAGWRGRRMRAMPVCTAARRA